MIEALADALQLTDDERIYLHHLARPASAKPYKPDKPAKPAAARPGTRQLIDALDQVPAVLVGIRTEVLAWNALGHLLLAGHLDADAPGRPADRRNLTRMMFLDLHHRDLYPDWQTEAACAAAQLRIAAGRYQDDRELAELIAELSINSERFAALWAEHPIASRTYGTRHLHHPQVGPLTLELETLLLSDGTGHRILTYSAPPDSPSHTALHLLHPRPVNSDYPHQSLIPPR